MTLRLQRVAARRIACAIVTAEVRRLRDRSLPPIEDGDWPDESRIGEDGLGLDSLERLGVMGALAETFDLDDALLGAAPPETVGDWIDWIMRGQAAGAGRLIVTTSGSTGTPRPCAHALADLVGEAAWLAAQLGDRRRVVALVPAHHLYGMIWTALLPAALGVPVIVRRIGAPLDLAAGDLVVAVPDQWRALLALTRLLPADIIGVSSAGTLDDRLARAVLGAGLARLIDVYASSETGAIALRDVPAADYALLPRWRLLAAGEDDWQLIDGSGGTVPLPDHVERTGERMLRPTGRRDGAVQVAGHNVWPERVAGVLREVDGVVDVAVRLHANGRLKAFIARADEDDAAVSAAVLERHAIARLSEPERPKSYRFGTALPRNMMGKLEDWA